MITGLLSAESDLFSSFNSVSFEEQLLTALEALLFLEVVFDVAKRPVLELLLFSFTELELLNRRELRRTLLRPPAPTVVLKI